MRAPNLLQRRQHQIAADPQVAEDSSGVVLLLDQPQEQVLRGDVLIPQAPRFLLGGLESVAEITRDGGLPSALDPGVTRQRVRHPIPEQGKPHAGLLQDRSHDSLFLSEEGRKQMHPGDLGMSPLSRHARCRLKGFP